MTSFHDCIVSALNAGQIDPIRAGEARRHFSEAVARYSTSMPIHQAQALAAKDVAEATRRGQRTRYHAVVNQLLTMRRIEAQVKAAPLDRLATTPRAMIENFEGSGYTGESVRSMTEALVSSVNTGIREVLDEAGLNVAGRSRNPVLLTEMIRELHGEATGNPRAVVLARAVRAQQERLLRLFNAAGGAIGQLADYGVPHAHDAARLMHAGFDAWAEAITPHLAWDRIIDMRTGQPFAAPGALPAPADIRPMLKDIYDGITTRGMDDRAPSLQPGGKALYNTRADHRVLHFKSGSAWMEYNGKFGSTDPFSAMMGGLHGVARDVAVMRVLGPNPKAGLEYAVQLAEKRIAAEIVADTAAGGANRKALAKLQKRITSQGKLAQTMLAHQTGAASVPQNAAWAAFFGGTRAVLTSAQLGSALLSSVTDFATMRTAASIMGLHQGNMIANSVRLLADSASREEAARMGYVAEALAEAGAASSRYFGDMFGSGLPDRLASFTMRVSGLSFVTDMRKVAFQMEFSALMAHNGGRAWGDIDAPLRAAFEARGITPADWDALRGGPRFVARNGADFIAPLHWLEHQTALPRIEAEGLALRLQALIHEQLEFAVPTASLEGRARMVGMAAPGSIGGELLRSTAMYKSFALSLTLGQYRRFQTLPSGTMKVHYAALLFAPLLLLGALAIQLKELAKGHDVRPMNDTAFWMAAGLQSGGLGIFGDFFSSSTSRVGGGLASTAAGPVVGFLGDLAKPIASNIDRTVKGETALWGRDASNLVRRYTPVLSSLWFQRAAFDRIVADQLQGFLDPEAELMWKQQQRRREKEFRNLSWWDRGRLTPSRLPDLSNAFGGTP